MLTFELKVSIDSAQLAEWGPEQSTEFFRVFGALLRQKALCDIAASKEYLTKKIADSEKLNALLEKIFSQVKGGELDIDKEYAAIVGESELTDVKP